MGEVELYGLKLFREAWGDDTMTKRCWRKPLMLIVGYFFYFR